MSLFSASVLRAEDDKPVPNKLSDKELVAKIREAVEKKIDPEKVQEFVGTKPTLSTVGDENTLRFSLVTIDYENRESVPKWDKRKNVIYWVRPIESKRTKVIGIFYLKDGGMQIFEGEVATPE
ncbi:MAG: hypothetical protein M5U26_27465 [Planctomycetota bacterium]|nr:hypothetical protein [Planctomycetota bacterium]